MVVPISMFANNQEPTSIKRSLLIVKRLLIGHLKREGLFLLGFVLFLIILHVLTLFKYEWAHGVFIAQVP